MPSKLILTCRGRRWRRRRTGRGGRGRSWARIRARARRGRRARGCRGGRWRERARPCPRSRRCPPACPRWRSSAGGWPTWRCSSWRPWWRLEQSWGDYLSGAWITFGARTLFLSRRRIMYMIDRLLSWFLIISLNGLYMFRSIFGFFQLSTNYKKKYFMRPNKILLSNWLQNRNKIFLKQTKTMFPD